MYSIKKLFFNIFRFIFLFLKVKNNKIVFMNFGGKSYGDNPKYITEEFLNTNTDLDLVWLLNDISEDLNPKIRKVKFGSLKSIYEYSTAKVIINNVRSYHLNKKRNNQIYIQTWHGSGAYKLVEAQVEDKLKKDYLKQAKYDAKITNAILVDCDYTYNLFKNYFWLNDKVEYLKYGFPCYDILINDNNENKKNVIRNKYNIKKTDYIVLYAPTFRDNGSNDGYIKNFVHIKKIFEKSTNKHVKIFVRFHPNVDSSKMDIKYDDDIIASTSKDDLKELALISDIIISDYSSTMNDFLILKKPAIIYACDYEEYIKNRNFPKEYYDYPFIRTYNMEELENAIINFDLNKYNEKLEEYNKNHSDFNKGIAAKKTVEWILDKMEVR